MGSRKGTKNAKKIKDRGSVLIYKDGMACFSVPHDARRSPDRAILRKRADTPVCPYRTPHSPVPAGTSQLQTMNSVHRHFIHRHSLHTLCSKTAEQPRESPCAITFSVYNTPMNRPKQVR